MKRLKLLLSILITVAALLAGWWWISGNVRVLLNGDFIRSGQLSPGRMERLVAARNIQTVIMLRGEKDKERWYQDERDLCQRLGIEYDPITMSAHLFPPVRAIRTLEQLHREAKRPILIHCLGGKDRTGFASAFFLVLEGQSPEEALVQLSLRTLHLCKRDHCPLHGFFDLYDAYLKEGELSHDTGRFKEWAIQVYCPTPYASRLEVLTFPESAAPGAIVEGSVKVTNLSSEPWGLSAEISRGIRFGIRLLGPLEELPPRGDEEEELFFHRHRFQAHDLLRVGMEDDTWQPQETRVLPFTMTMPDKPGRYLYRLDMVDEGVSWFYVRGYPAKYREVTITP